MLEYQYLGWTVNDYGEYEQLSWIIHSYGELLSISHVAPVWKGCRFMFTDRVFINPFFCVKCLQLITNPSIL